MGYELAWAILQTRRLFLLRMSSKIDLYTMERATLTTWSEGPVYYWPAYVQKQEKPPIACRLIRVPAKGQVKRDVWLLTDVLDPTRLSAATAAKFYRWRWRNEGLFRRYKRTINKMKLSSRTVRLVHREAEASRRQGNYAQRLRGCRADTPGSRKVPRHLANGPAAPRTSLQDRRFSRP